MAVLFGAVRCFHLTAFTCLHWCRTRAPDTTDYFLFSLSFDSLGYSGLCTLRMTFRNFKVVSKFRLLPLVDLFFGNAFEFVVGKNSQLHPAVVLTPNDCGIISYRLTFPITHDSKSVAGYVMGGQVG